ncbi:MAG: cupin domain-containing protein [Burkholderiaceae bacterium]|jgi:50S ribosomal protein L16 3-hydroxylase|nr:cupin domain-containing protein [Burkholderiaceae bacterium]
MRQLKQALPLLAGLTPRQFMKRHWQKRPLLVRNAIAGFKPPVGRADLFRLAAQEDVESRLIDQRDGQWRLRRGPLARRTLPALHEPGWTVLVQGVNLYSEAVHALMRQFRFVPDARLDDVMISYATDQGGVGPHFDSYDVFLLQALGQRRWRIGRQKDKTLIAGLPVKMLAHFEPEEEHVLDPGDMLYLPPGWAHDGVAVGECLTYSIGFSQPQRVDLARELLQRLSDDVDERLADATYRDPAQSASDEPAYIPAEMRAFARDALHRAVAQPDAVDLCFGEWLTEPKGNVWFEPGDQATETAAGGGGIALDRRSKMLYDKRYVFLNGEGFAADGRDARLMRQLANERCLGARERVALSADARALVDQWLKAGWMHVTK